MQGTTFCMFSTQAPFSNWKLLSLRSGVDAAYEGSVMACTLASGMQMDSPFSLYQMLVQFWFSLSLYNCLIELACSRARSAHVSVFGDCDAVSAASGARNTAEFRAEKKKLQRFNYLRKFHSASERDRLKQVSARLLS